jgi:hypothetical protein
MGDDYTANDDGTGGYSADDPGPSLGPSAGSDYGQQFYAVGSDYPATIPDDRAGSNAEGTYDAMTSTAWDVGGALPFVGTAVSVVSTGIDVVEAGVALAQGDTSHAWRKVEDAGMDAIGIIPLAGSVVSGLSAINDGIATGFRQEGASNAEAPTVNDEFARRVDSDIDILKAVYDAIVE